MPYKSVRVGDDCNTDRPGYDTRRTYERVWDTGGDEGQHHRSLGRSLVETNISHERLGRADAGKYTYEEMVEKLNRLRLKWR